MKTSDLSQIDLITRVSPHGSFNLKKAVFERAPQRNGFVQLYMGTDDKPSQIPIKKTTCLLPPRLVERFALKGGGYIALSHEGQNVRAKPIELSIVEETSAAAFDEDHGCHIIRTLATAPSPEKYLAHWAASAQECQLRHSVSAYLSSQSTLSSYKTRQLIGLNLPDDSSFAEQLTAEIAESQAQNGSWSDDIVITARNVATLIDLRHDQASKIVRHGCEWLIETDESPHNPGMFFLSNNLVKEQMAIVKRRANGERDRFRKRTTSEMKRVKVFDPLIIEPCGPRIMWPNAFVLDVLLSAGYEQHPRMQRNIATLSDRRWCECGYQHGIDDHPLINESAVASLEREAALEWKYGGLHSPDELMKMDGSKPSGRRMGRVSKKQRKGRIIYELDFDGDFPTCGFVTMEALGNVTDPLTKRFAAARMVRMAANLPKTQFRAIEETTRFWTSPFAVTLRGFHRYNHPIAQGIILRALPWIIDTQNADGSWGDGIKTDDTTHAILSSLISVLPFLPKLAIS